MPSPADIFPIPGIQPRLYTLEEVQAAFKAMDIDKNGCLDDSDLRNMLLLSGAQANEEEIREMIRMVDHDGTGIVSFDEFAQMCLYPDPLFQNVDLLPTEAEAIDVEELDQSVRQSSLQTVESRSNRMHLLTQLTENGRMSQTELKHIFQKFQKVDKDGSGMVGYREFLLVLDKEDSAAMRRVFSLFDTDACGEIELKEFVVGLNTLPDQASKDKTKFAFKVFDLDGSGFIDRNELVKIVKANLKAQGQLQMVTNEVWLDRRIDLLYDEIQIPRNTPISEAKFAQLADVAPDLIMPALEEFTDVGSRLAF